MMPLKIFINYRRDDTSATAGRLHDFLASELGGSAQLFMDVDSIPLGKDFVPILEKAVGNCDVFLAIIGSKWLSTTDGGGNRRLDIEDDPVRVEIAAALKGNILVIPIVVDGTKLPKPYELPETISTLARHHGLELRNSAFRSDATQLVRELKKQRIEARTSRLAPIAGAIGAPVGFALTYQLETLQTPIWERPNLNFIISLIVLPFVGVVAGVLRNGAFSRSPPSAELVGLVSLVVIYVGYALWFIIALDPFSVPRFTHMKCA
jgi:hypothetical protein